MRFKFCALAFALVQAAFIGPSTGVRASEAPATLVDETFTDGDLTGGSDPLDLAWFPGGSSTISIIDDAGGLGAGNALQFLSTGNFARVVGVFPSPVTVAQPGDLITIDLRLRMTRFSGSNNGAIRFGLHHDNGSPITAANVGENWTDLTDGWDGYYFRGGTGTEPGMRIYKDLPVAGNSALGGSGDVTLGDGTSWALNDSAVHTIRIEILRTINAQNTLRFHLDGVRMQEISTATAGGEMSAFTSFAIGTGSAEVDLVVDDVKLTLLHDGGGPVLPIDLSARLIDWTSAGVEGGIPNYPTVLDFADAGGDKTGLTDNSPRLQNIINGLANDTVIFFPAGVYRFNRRINFANTPGRNLPGIVIRGAGTRDTKLLFMDSVEEDAGLLDVTGYAANQNIPISAGLTKGSTTVTLQSTQGIMTGTWLAIRQDNDAAAMATTRDISDYLDSINNSSGWAARVVGQVVRVTNVNSNTVTLDRPLHLDFTWANPPATVITMATGIGFEDFTLEHGVAAPKRINFDFAYAANSWIKNVHSLMAMRYHVGTLICANLTIRDSYFNDAWRHDGGGHGYGTLIADTTTHCLIENNVFRNLRHAMIWKEGANGNVFSSNYSTDGNQEGSAVAKDISGHGHYAFANLIEGNIAQFIHASDFWGPIGPNNMFLRNRTTEERILIEDGTKNQNIIGNQLVSPSTPFVVVDGTSTGAFIHGNNEGGLISWREGEAQSVPASYFHQAKPAFWNITDPWPAIGPEQAAGTYTIPARRRWDTGQMNLFVAPAPGIRRQPASIAVEPGGNATLTAEADAFGPATYKWRKNGFDLVDGGRISGTSTLTLTITGATAADAGTYTLVGSTAGGATVSAPALLSIWSPDAGRLSNLSTRGQVRTGNNILIAGFVLVGTGPRTMLLRGVGPGLGEFLDPASVLADPAITVFSGSNPVSSNDNWSTQPDAAEIATLSAQLGAFDLAQNSKDAALRVSLNPGAYSVHLSGAGDSGLGLVELYDGDSGAGSRLMNISTRGRVETGNSIMVPGIVVSGSPRRLLIRGVGPELAAAFGFAPGDVLPDPVLTLVNAAGATIATNNDWGTGNDTLLVASVTEQVGAFPLAAGSRDAVLLIEVPAGAYTAQVSDSAGREGIAIVEVYAAP